VIRPGEPWGSPTSSPPDIEVPGGDAVLARAVAGAPGALVQLRPDAGNDLARAIGLRPDEPLGDALTEVPVDALRLADVGSPNAGGRSLAVNMCVLGVAPDRLRWWSPSVEIAVLLDGKAWFSGPATTVVIANGQFLRGLDVVPRGHPGDGRAEVQVYELERRERRSMRARLASGAHLPHPRIRSRSAAEVEVQCARRLDLEVDGETRTPISDVHVAVVPAAFRLLV
jgi:diacylglycerol kinase family enzyme